jgi:two-component system response regulator LytT
METQPKKSNSALGEYTIAGAGDYIPQSFRGQSTVTGLKEINEFKDFFQQGRQPGLDALLNKLAAPAGKKSFLVFKRNKYIIIPTESIAFFYVKYETSIIVCFDRQEYSVNHSLEHIQNLLPDKQFFRLNRQYLINFDAVKEVEHYFARKLLVNLVVAVSEKLLVSKEKVSHFFNWLENR